MNLGFVLVVTLLVVASVALRQEDVMEDGGDDDLLPTKPTRVYRRRL
jgi:hypothetical protein